MEQPTKRQVGGSHYVDLAITPREYGFANGLDFDQINIVKYVTRHKTKNGKQDILKAIHYCELLLEREYKHENGNDEDCQ